MAYQRESRLDVINLSQKCQRGIHGYRQTFDKTVGSLGPSVKLVTHSAHFPKILAAISANF